MLESGVTTYKIKMAEELEDAVTFLERAKAVYPNVTSLLNTTQLLALDTDLTVPYSDQKTANEDFVKLTEAYFVTKHSMDMTKNALRLALMEPHASGKQVDVEEEEKVIQCLKKVQERIKRIWDEKLRVTEKEKGEGGLPRIIRLSRRLKLSEKETLVMIYVLTCQVGEARTSAIRFGRFAGAGVLFGNDTLSVCKACNLKISEIVIFLNQDREHMQQGIFPDVQQSFLLHSALNFDEVSCKALVGAPLKANEFLKVEQTHLADIIAEEAGNEHLRMQEGAPASPDPKKTDEGEVPPTDTKLPPPLGSDMAPMAPLTAGVPVLPGMPPEGPPKVEEEEEKKEGEEEGKEEGEGEGEGEEVGEEEREEEGEVADLDILLRREREKEKKRKEGPQAEEAEEQETNSDKLPPYKTDLEYLDDHFQLVAQKIKVKSMESRIEMEAQYDDEMRDARTLRQKREAESKEKVLHKKCEKRMMLTRSAGSWVPRLERMVSSRGLSGFEKHVLLTLIGFVIQPNKIVPFEYMGMGMGGQSSFSVGELLRLFCSSLKEQIKHRMYFYKTATLVREGMIIVHNSGLTGDPTSAKVEIDRRMLDFCVGLDTEFSEIVEGSHLYYPKTKFEQVILSKDQKQLILNTVSNFESFKRCRKRMGLDDAITYGAGMVMLFHGAPGTGKTMMANALANKLNKKVLLINFPSLGSFSAGENFKFIFREAKINDAILFFDECEAIFESRERGSHDVNMLLTEIERHDGLIIMATNRPYDLDEAMHRRIMIAIEFRQPDHLLRKAIWQSHIPEQMKMADDIDLNELALRFELTGGFIKNAVLSALSLSVSRDGDNPVVCHKDLRQGANLQLRGRLRMKDFHRRVVPSAGLDKVIVSDELARSLKEIVQFEKARSVLFGQWGFGANEQQGITVLLHGAPGTGKSLAAAALGYEVGKPLKVVNCGELLSKWVGESTKNIDAIFEEARHSDAILVFDEAEGLFGSRTTMTTSTDRYANVDVGVLLYHIERFPGIIILTTNLIDNIDKAFFRRLRFVLQFDIPPFKLRTKMWRLLIPEETPLADDVDFERLARHEMSGGNVKSAVFRAASRAALRPDEDRKLAMQDLEEAAQEEMGKTSTRTSFRRQDSDAARMYN